MNRDFPCKKCHHAASKHYSNVCQDEFICVTCSEGGRMDWIEPNEHLHKFEGDNLKYMEFLNKREEIRND
jgi:hypothetical protein